MFKPMLACAIGGTRQGIKYTIEHDLSLVKFPVIVSDKEDGFRAFKPKNTVLTRSGKTIKNILTKRIIETHCPPGLDGELKTYTNGVPDSFSTVQSKLTSFDGAPEFKYFVFDLYSTMQYSDRIDALSSIEVPSFVTKLDMKYAYNIGELLALEADALARGKEGICFRPPGSPYKFGRATFNQQWLFKLTRWTTDECTIIGFVEQFENTNPQFENELGGMSRSSSQVGKIGKNTLGSFIVDWHGGIIGEISGGPGIDNAFRLYVWNHKEEFLYKTMTFRYKDYGTKDFPRSAQWVGIRSKDDM